MYKVCSFALYLLCLFKVYHTYAVKMLCIYVNERTSLLLEIDVHNYYQKAIFVVVKLKLKTQAYKFY